MPSLNRPSLFFLQHLEELYMTMIWPKILCLALLCSVATAPRVPETGVVNGTEADYPFMAALRLSAETKPFCGGAILDSEHIITAAHCFDGKDVNDVEVVMGLNNTSEDISKGQTRKVIQSFDHPKYIINSPSLRYDFTILRLTTPIKFTEKVKPICLPSSQLKTQDLLGKNLTVAGWGGTEKYHEFYSKVLRKTYLDVMNMEHCKKRFERKGKQIKNSIQLCCQGRESGSFAGDSGGPIFRLKPNNKSYEILGITSFGHEYANQTNSGDPPSVYTFVPPFLCSITNTISMTENRRRCR